MCQLTYCNLGNAKYNRLMVYLLMVEGAIKNDDGTGIICSSGAGWKTKLAANMISNLGEILRDNITDNSPVPAHIRLATFGIPVEDKNAHPFVGKKFILMHNGTLQPKSDDAKNKKDKGSDSEEFLSYLEKVAKAKKDNSSTFVDIFNEAIEEFTGKFAFIIRHQTEPSTKDYIIRGKTADLYISYLSSKSAKGKLTKLGYIVNTSKEVIKESIVKFVNLLDISSNDSQTLQFSDPELLQEETIFLAEPLDLKEVGKTKETAKPAIVYSTQHAITRAPSNSFTSSHNVSKEAFSKMTSYAARISEFLRGHFMSERDFQRLFYLMGEVSVLELRENDIVFFVEQIIPILSASKSAKKAIADALRGDLFPDSAYKDLNLPYPWTLAIQGPDAQKATASIVNYINSRRKAYG